MLTLNQGNCDNCNKSFANNITVQGTAVECNSYKMTKVLCDNCKSKGCNCGGKYLNTLDKFPNTLG